jgi:hypothetical protein
MSNHALDRKVIFLGQSPEDRKGDKLRVAMQKVQDNFEVLFSHLDETGLGNSNARVVLDDDPRLSDARPSIHPSGNHEEDYYALRNGSADENFNAAKIIADVNLVLNDPSNLGQSTLIREIQTQFGVNYSNLPHTSLVNEGLDGRRQAFILSDTNTNDSNSTLVGLSTLETQDDQDSSWTSRFRIAGDNSLHLNGREIIDKDGQVALGSLNKLIADAPFDLDTLGEIADKLNSLSNQSSTLVEFEFNEPALEWIVQHNRNTLSFSLTVWDQEGNQEYGKIRSIDEDAFKIVFTEAVSGKVSVVFQ